VGGADGEVFTDKYGRVKVQFHWDLATSATRTPLVGSASHRLGRSGFGAQFLPASAPGGGDLPRRRPRPTAHHRHRLQRHPSGAVRCRNNARRAASARRARRAARAAASSASTTSKAKKRCSSRPSASSTSKSASTTR
jgi:hypothetical protein